MPTARRTAVNVPAAAAPNVIAHASSATHSGSRKRYDGKWKNSA